LYVDSQREAVVPISKKGRELYNSIIWLPRYSGLKRMSLRFLKTACFLCAKDYIIYKLTEGR